VNNYITCKKKSIGKCFWKKAGYEWAWKFPQARQTKWTSFKLSRKYCLMMGKYQNFES
jgi:hypothetical protein